ncbi:MAG: hypothetical protein AB1645_09185 [Bacillota bacterium]|jgi:hypothetical protein
MARRYGKLTVEYEGRIPRALREHLEAVGIRVTGLRPLTLLTGDPEVVLNQIWRYLQSDEMRVRRVQLRATEAA